MMMTFTPHSQNELKNFPILEGQNYTIEYVNKDYFNGEETLEKGTGTAIMIDDNIYFNVVDPYGMDKLIMKAKVLL